jgi:hypothetical protein
MSGEELRSLHSSHLQSQEKYTYFLLAAAASAIAFAVQKTADAVLTWQLCVLGVAVVCWSASFYCGCKRLQWVQVTLYANYALLQLQGGVHPEQPTHPVAVAAVADGVRSATNKNSQRAKSYGDWQFRFITLGAIMFLAWHITMILDRTSVGA